MDAAAANELLRQAETTRRRTRRARRALWLPLAVFGLIVLGATPFYRNPTEPPVPSVTCTGTVATGISCPAAPEGIFTRSIPRPGPIDLVSGFNLPDGGRWASIYWLIALPLGYALIAWLFRRRAAKRGVSASYTPYVVAGVVFLAFLWAIAPGHAHYLGLHGRWVTWQQFPFFQGLTPLLTIALGLFALAWVERSRSYAAFAIAFLGVACMAGAYNVENLFFRIGWSVPAPQINVIVPAVVLILGAAVFWIADLRRA